MMRLINTLFAVMCISGCSSLELPPHNLSDAIVNYTPGAPIEYENWVEGEKQHWRQLEKGLEDSKNRYDNAFKELAQSSEKGFIRLSEDIEISEGKIAHLESKITRTEDENRELKNLEQQLTELRLSSSSIEKRYETESKIIIEKYKRAVFKFEINTDKLLEKVSKGSTDDDDDGSDPRDTDPPPVFGEEIDPATLTGYEVFINIGGVAGSSLEGPAQAALEAGYQRHGFRINTITKAMSWDPIRKRMKYVASVYQQNNIELKYVVFHHGGHGWENIISYESTAQNAQGQFTMQRGTSTKHQTIFNTLGNTFSATVAQFPNTLFGVVLDACAQGNAVDRSVAGRRGFVATSTPAIRWYHFNKGDSYYFSGTYIYSNFFGNFLQQANSTDDPDSKTNVLNAAHNNANQQSASALMGNGEYKRF